MEAIYANYFAIGHNAFEFLLDFGRLFVEQANPQVYARIVTSPGRARDFSNSLNESIAHYEHTFGAIPADRDE